MYKLHIRIECFSYLGLIVLLCSTQQGFAAGTVNKEFSHLLTGFPLTGAHRRSSCETCHVRGIFKGTPSRCGVCHTTGSMISEAIGKPSTHIQSSNRCDDCHTESAWLPARFDHGDVSIACIRCHNGSIAPGKTANHIQSANTCNDCHASTAWLPARMDHSGIAASCFTCHNGILATGKTANHVQSSNNCGDCHRTRYWRPATFDHTNVAPGTCTRCHVNDKPANHVQTSSECDFCHTSIAWLPANFDHQNVTQACSACHQQPMNHYATTQPCNTCHVSTTWTISNYAHTSPAYPGEHQRRLICADCHKNNYAVFPWPNAALQPDCAACHDQKYDPQKHMKTETPKTFYTVSELRDCTGSCHFTDGNNMLIMRNAKHSLRQW